MSIAQTKQMRQDRRQQISAEYSDRNTESYENLTLSSDDKVWWSCALGHEWQAVLRNRVYRPDGCPYCGGRRTINSSEMLHTLYPQYAGRWGDRNKEVDFSVLGTRDSIWWKCLTADHEYQSGISELKRGRGCPYCNNSKVLVGFNDMATTHPDLVHEWSSKNDTAPQDIVAGSNKKVWWVCVEYRHEWNTSPNHRAYGSKTSCPVCSMRSSKPEETINTLLMETGRTVPQAKTTSRWPTGQYMIADALLEREVCFEYDGRYWHGSKTDLDTKKTETWLDDGYTVIRFRDQLPLLDIEHEKLLQIVVDYRDEDHLAKPVAEAIKWMKAHRQGSKHDT